MQFRAPFPLREREQYPQCRDQSLVSALCRRRMTFSLSLGESRGGVKVAAN